MDTLKSNKQRDEEPVERLNRHTEFRDKVEERFGNQANLLVGFYDVSECIKKAKLAGAAKKSSATQEEQPADATSMASHLATRTLKKTTTVRSSLTRLKKNSEAHLRENPAPGNQ